MLKLLLYLGGVAVMLTISGCFFLGQEKFGRLPKGDRLDRLAQSPNYRDGTFHNRVPFERIVKGGGGLGGLIRFAFRDGDGLTPPAPVPVVKTDLKGLDPNRDVVVWLGHSSYFVRLGGRAILIDPVFSAYASPVWFSTRAFAGTSVYTAEDMPHIDYLLISHDHWDHLDYATVTALKDKIGNVVTGLGVGEHFSRWGFPEEMIHEADWDEDVRLDDTLVIHVLTARHFSGRMFDRNRTLWVSFALETPSRRIYYSGDSGYGPHFKEIGERFGGFDFAMVECGQYNEAWPDVHMMPEQSARAVEELKAREAMPCHNGKFSIAYHSWDEPLKRFSEASRGKAYKPATPEIGEVVDLADREQPFDSWWAGI
ncbi:MAG: MBL fold metallo-hydrolase [Pseudodesulfovibrio sp.]|uniref:MBL fold metallo-hydrolase n=1 Tax=Pseudodesulfovibrio sp. TaxID=2035812 RepID=UPI003D0FB48F